MSAKEALVETLQEIWSGYKDKSAGDMADDIINGLSRRGLQIRGSETPRPLEVGDKIERYPGQIYRVEAVGVDFTVYRGPRGVPVMDHGNPEDLLEYRISQEAQC